jgi:hypothetical protein
MIQYRADFVIQFQLIERISFLVDIQSTYFFQVVQAGPLKIRKNYQKLFYFNYFPTFSGKAVLHWIGFISKYCLHAAGAIDNSHFYLFTQPF